MRLVLCSCIISVVIVTAFGRPLYQGLSGGEANSEPLEYDYVSVKDFTALQVCILRRTPRNYELMQEVHAEPNILLDRVSLMVQKIIGCLNSVKGRSNITPSREN